MATATRNEIELPPQNLDAEKALLGCLFMASARIDDVVELVSAEDFYSDDNCQIFRVMCEMHNDGIEIDTISVADQLQKKDLLQDIGVQYLNEIMETVPYGMHADYYARIVSEKAVRRQIIYAADEAVRDSRNQSLDIEKLLSTVDGRFASIAERQTKSTTVDLREVLLDAIAQMDSGKPKGLFTGYHDLDKLTNGLQPGSVTILGARPSMGKTAFAGNVALRVAKSGKPIFFVSLEQTQLELAERFLCMESKVNSHNLRSNDLTDDQRRRLMETSNEMSSYPIFIEDSAGLNMLQIASLARKMKRRNSIELLVIDYLQYIAPEDRRDPREQQIAAISRRLKYLAKNLNIPIICLAQLNRLIEMRQEKEPRLSDLRESGALEQDADMVWLLHRPGEYDDNIDKSITKLLVAKHRNGQTGNIFLDWNEGTMNFVSKSGMADDYIDTTFRS